MVRSGLFSRYRTRTGDRVTVARSNATITTLQLVRENKYRTHTDSTGPVIQPLSGGMLARRNSGPGRVIFRPRGWKGWREGGGCPRDIYSFISFNNLLIM